MGNRARVAGLPYARTMFDAPPSADRASALVVPLRRNVYRYFFYDWLFRDADRGSGLERAAALRHNREQARWLPLYMIRWLIIGAILVGIESLLEQLLRSPVVSATLWIALIVVVLFLLITVVGWSFLQAGRRSR